MPDTRVIFAFLGLIFCAGASAGNDSVTPTLSGSYPTRDSLAAFYDAAPVSFAQLAKQYRDR